MSVILEDECVGCPKEIGCLGSSCPHRNVAHFYCDSCEEEVEELYEVNSEQLCVECILNRYEKVTVSE